MTKIEAISLMRAGHKITHRYFSPGEWLTSNPSGTQYQFEDGVKCSSDLFWMDRKGEQWTEGYELIQSKNNGKK